MFSYVSSYAIVVEYRAFLSCCTLLEAQGLEVGVVSSVASVSYSFEELEVAWFLAIDTLRRLCFCNLRTRFNSELGSGASLLVVPKG